MTTVLCEDNECNYNTTKHRQGNDEPIGICSRDEIILKYEQPFVAEAPYCSSRDTNGTT